MAFSLIQIESEIDRFEVELIDLLEIVQEAGEIIDLILAGDGSARSKSRRMKVLRKGTQRGKAMIALLEDALDDLEEQRRLYLANELAD